MFNFPPSNPPSAHRGGFPAGWSRDGAPAASSDRGARLVLPADLQSAPAQPGGLGRQQRQRGLVVVQEHVDAVHVHPPAVADPGDCLPETGPSHGRHQVLPLGAADIEDCREELSPGHFPGRGKLPPPPPGGAGNVQGVVVGLTGALHLILQFTVTNGIKISQTLGPTLETNSQSNTTRYFETMNEKSIYSRLFFSFQSRLWDTFCSRK